VGDEVEAGAADACVVEVGDVGARERLVDHRHSGVPTPTTDERIDHRQVVDAVALACTNTARDSREPELQALERVDARVGWGVGAIG